MGNVANKSITVSNIFIPKPKDKEPPVIKDLYLNTKTPAKEVFITVVVEEENVSISWDGGATWGKEITTAALANTLHTVMVKDEAGNVATKSIEVSNIILPVQEPKEEEPEQNEDVSEDMAEEEPVEEVIFPVQEPEEEEPVIVIEPVTVEPEKIQGNITLVDVVTVAAPVTGGGCFFFFFGFWLLGKNATVYAQDGLQDKKLGKVKIKKKGQIFMVRIPSSILRRSTSNQLRLIPTKGFLKKHEGMYVQILCANKEISSRIEKEIRMED